jgi:adenylate cyclase
VEPRAVDGLDARGEIADAAAVGHRTVSYRVSLVVALPLLILLTGGIITTNSYFASRASIEGFARSLFDQAGDQIADLSRSHVREALPAADLVTSFVEASPTNPSPDEIGPDLIATLRSNPAFAWVNYSRADGTYMGASRHRDGVFTVWRTVFTDAGAVIDEGPVSPDGSYTYDPKLHRTGNYDPRKRPFWEPAVAAAHGRAWTRPYPFGGGDGIGMSCARAAYDKQGGLRGVVTVDFDLDILSTYITTKKPSANAEILVATADGLLLAHRSLLTPNFDYHASIPTVDSIADERFSAYLKAGRPPRFSVGGLPYFGATRAFEPDEGLEWQVTIIAPASDFMRDVDRAGRLSLVIAAVGILLAVLAAAFLANRIAVPLARIAFDMERVGDLELGELPQERTIFQEIAAMTAALATMKRGLRSFASYVPRGLVRAVLASGQAAELGGKTKTMTFFFSDLAGFTTLSEQMSPDALVKLLGGYFDEMTRIISQQNGTIDKFIGDAIMAFWNAPGEEPNHPARACVAALSCQARLAQMRRENPRLGAVHARIGLATGDALVGNIGSNERMNYTVMGDTVNLAARLEGINKLYGTSILVSEPTFEAVRDVIVGRPIDIVAVKGKTRGAAVYELLGERGSTGEQDERFAEACSSAFSSYRDRDFEAAMASWSRALTIRPNDAPAKMLLERTRAFAADAPPQDWTGVVVMKEK